MLGVQLQRSFQGSEGFSEEAASQAGLGLYLQKVDMQSRASSRIRARQGSLTGLHAILEVLCGIKRLPQAKHSRG